jgi:thiamine-phosphate diphosphorylase
MDPVALEQIIAGAIRLGRRYDARLYINDYWQLALKHGAYGVHLGQEDLERADLDALCKAGMHLGISTHSEAEWVRAATLKPSYLAIGAIFPTTTKTVIEVGAANLQRWANILHRRFPLVAIGGINIDNLDQVMAAPVGSVAVVSAITAAADPEAATRALMRRLADGWRHPIQG